MAWSLQLLLSTAVTAICGVLSTVVAWADSANYPIDSRAMTRLQRSLHFPEGSTFSLALCLTGDILPEVTTWNQAVATELSHELYDDKGDGNSTDSSEEGLVEEESSAVKTGDMDAGIAKCWRSRSAVYQNIHDAIDFLPEPVPIDDDYVDYWAASSRSSCAVTFAGYPLSLLDVALSDRRRDDLWW